MKGSLVFIWASVVIINVLTAFRAWSFGSQHLFHLHANRSDSVIHHHYTYVDDDYPFYYPISSGRLEDVAMTLYDSVHFGVETRPTGLINASAEMLDADAEWDLLSFLPTSYGRARLGPEFRIFLIVQNHLIHCLQAFYVAFTSSSGNPSPAIHHAMHCVNYVRQSFLCSADGNLEEGDFIDDVLTEEDAELLPLEERGERLPGPDAMYTAPGSNGCWHPGRIRSDVVCKDWDALYQDLEWNFKQWLDWKQEWD
ncbi:hypothetical protein SCHPADRAFT_206585 [Schizopora paradoxa]|uniref:Uncharacterized protein n=1 Tax=Schizopora paradoxa TaxID=27342 RepID=A0A0H2S4K0_9AGAM|nr:hypothetical protein SCHPADRAFT_206585 [Schizopora paradoxa]